MPETITVDKWFVQWPDPRPVITVRETLTRANILTTKPENVTVDRWFRQLSVPLPPPRGLPPALQIFRPILTYGSPETVTVDRWMQPFSQPVLRRPFVTGGYQFMLWNSVSVTPVAYVATSVPSGGAMSATLAMGGEMGTTPVGAEGLMP